MQELLNQISDKQIIISFRKGDKTRTCVYDGIENNKLIKKELDDGYIIRGISIMNLSKDLELSEQRSKTKEEENLKLYFGKEINDILDSKDSTKNKVELLLKQNDEDLIDLNNKTIMALRKLLNESKGFKKDNNK